MFQTRFPQAFDTIVFGLGPIGLLSVLAALERGEKVAAFTDREPQTGLGIRQPAVQVSPICFDFVKKFIRQGVFDGIEQDAVYLIGQLNTQVLLLSNAGSVDCHVNVDKTSGAQIQQNLGPTV